MFRRISILAIFTLVLATLGPSAIAQGPAADGAPIRLQAGTFHPAEGDELSLPAEFLAPPGVPGQSGEYLVQFAGPVETAWRAALEGVGAKIVAYIPEFAYHTQMTPQVAAAARRMDFVRWVGPFHPAYKVARGAERGGLLHLSLAPEADAQSVSIEIAAAGGRVAGAAGSVVVAELPQAAVPELARSLDVTWIEPAPQFEFFNNIARGAGGGLEAFAMWNLGIFGEGQIAGIADSGLDNNDLSTLHEDFRGRVVKIDRLGNSSTNSTDTVGHGTHTAGSMVGNGAASGTNPNANDFGQGDNVNPNVTTTKVAGMAPKAGLYFEVTACWYGLCPPSDLNNLFLPAYSAGARVHSNSWGNADAMGAYLGGSQQTDTFIWNHPDMNIAFAVGNAGKDADSDGYTDEDNIAAPATAKNTLSIGASENARTNGGINIESTTNDLDETQCSDATYGEGAAYRNCNSAGFSVAPTGTDLIGGTGNEGQLMAASSRGPTNDGRIKPDLVAPGANILSTKSRYDPESTTIGGALASKYAIKSGTSMATPLAAGAAVLTREWYADVKGIPSPSAALIKATLINTAVDLSGYGGSAREAGQPIPNMHEGWGRINLGNVVADGREVVDGQSVTTGQVRYYPFQVSDSSKPLKVSLVWSDYPASTSASKSLVNDLNLIVSGPGMTYLGNVFSGGWSVTGGTADAVNNVENVYVQTPASGEWTIEVRGSNVPQGPQPFALVYGVRGNTPPNATFGVTCANLTCAFDGSASTDSDGAITSHGWDFGDGTTGTGSAVSHTYQAAGTYTARLTVTDNAGATGVTSKPVTVQSLPRIHVGDLDGSRSISKSSWSATATIKVHNASHSTVSSVAVSGTWTVNGSSSGATCTTSSKGTCSVTKSGIAKGVAFVTFEVKGLTNSAYSYDPSANHDPETDSNGTAIQIKQ